MSDQLPFGEDPIKYEQALRRIAWLLQEVEDAVDAGERQAEINVELMRLMDQVCPDCQEVIRDALREEGEPDD